MAPQNRPDPGDSAKTNRQARNRLWFQWVRRATGDGMKKFGCKGKFSPIVAAAAIGVAIVLGCAGTSARAADDDEDSAFDTKIVRGILNAFGFRRDGEAIEYRERPPLALPPGKTPPPPERNNPASKTAGWPDDPDVKQVKQRKDAERNRKAYTEGVDDRPLLPSQYGRPAPASPSSRPTGGERSAEEKLNPSSQAELGAKNIFNTLWAPQQEAKTFTGEPPRASLIEPPRGYRTPSPNQPYGVGLAKPKAQDINDRSMPVR